MAKDGTNRGGKRIGAGKKRKSLGDKILDGTADFGGSCYETETSKRVKPPKKYLTADQKGGGKLYAKKIYTETAEWLAAHDCESIIPQTLIENYALAMGRHIQCEEYLSQFGLIAAHPTTGEPVTSPFFKMSNEALKTAHQLWLTIYSAVKENAPQGMRVSGLADDMESLLSKRF